MPLKQTAALEDYSEFIGVSNLGFPDEAAATAADAAAAPKPTPPHKPRKPGVRLIKIQKTASSSLGDYIIPQFCGENYSCTSDTHMEWNEATRNGKYPGPVITMLRDPVERALSEFFFLRDTDGRNSMVQPQWDFFRENDTYLNAIQDDNISKALDIFIHGWSKNPSRNRQALYLLGFRGPADEVMAKPPGEVYDWDSDPRMFASKAMAKLEKLTAFGIVDCWASSMRAIAKSLGWDAEKVVASTADRHERNWRTAMVARHKPDYWRLKKWLGKDIPQHTKWSEEVPQRYLDDIKRWSNVDMLLYQEAKARFSKKFHEPC